jgi:peptidoglycan hydrolase-like protein with peptidoglycan-binding domain
MENPVATGGLMVMALTATAIVSNALFLQNGAPLNHGARPTAPRAAPAVPLPRPRAQSLLAPTPSVAPRSTHTAALAPPLPVPAPEPASLRPDPVTADMQRELARLGLYGGSVDGLPGPLTRAAITDYQTAAGLKPTGVATPELVAWARRPPPAAPTRTAVVQPAPAVVPADEAYRRVQIALNQIGYGPIAVDGRPGSATADAVRRFQLDNGLALTGVPDEAVIRRLVAIGALSAG